MIIFFCKSTSLGLSVTHIELLLHTEGVCTLQGAAGGTWIAAGKHQSGSDIFVILCAVLCLLNFVDFEQ